MLIEPSDRELMRVALELAAESTPEGDVPVGAVVVSGSGEILGRGVNRREIDHDPSGHAEVLALREAARFVGNWRLD